MTVLIAGGGIGGLVLALTCHQIGVPAKVLESASELKPLGVGINLQPNAVRELIDLGLEADLQRIGVATREFAMFSKLGLEIWSEPRGRRAGYNWPQYSVHRGQLQMLLYRAVLERLGGDAIETGCRVTGYANNKDRVTVHVETEDGGGERHGDLLIGADGLHSATRAQMMPGEGPPIWAGAILWRGATGARPFRTGATMALIGHGTQRFVTYPISSADPDTGEALVNWIAEITVDPAKGWNREDWNRRADKSDFMHAFTDWKFDWIDIPALVEATEAIFEYPMVDRDPLPGWRDGRVTLMGDAAHIMYPVGSNGASQAVVDARKLGRAFLDHGVTPEALQAYEDELRPATSKMIVTNRSAGPDQIMQIVEDRCGGRFDDINDVLPKAEMAEIAARYKTTAGFSIADLNASPAIIPEGARVAV